MCSECSALMAAIDRYIAKSDEDLSNLLTAEGYADAESTVDYISELEDDIAEALTAQTQYFVLKAEKAVDLEAFYGAQWEAVKANDAIAAKLYKAFSKRLTTFMPHYVDVYIKLTDKKMGLKQISKRTIAWVESWSVKVSDLMKLSSHEEIESVLKKGLENGEGIQFFIRQLQDGNIRDEYYKARRAAVTEVLRAHSVAAQEAQMQSPSISDKRWRHTGSHKNTPRENHVDMDGQTVPKDQPYILTGTDGVEYHPMFPRDPELPPSESVNCHCLSQGIVNDEVLGLSLEEREKLQQQALDEMDKNWEQELNAKNRAQAGIE